MAISGGRVELIVAATGEDRISSVLKTVNRQLDETARRTEQTTKSTKKASGGIRSFSTGLTRLAGRLGLVGMVASTAFKVYNELSDVFDIQTGAKAADQFDVLSKSISGFEDIVAQAKKATAGMIPESEIVKGAALFHSFGLDVAQLPKALEQVTKTAIRTGQDAKFLANSLVTGIARQSPMILDNLGLTIKLSDATAKAAEMFGKEADALTEVEKRAGWLALAQEGLAKANENVNLSASRTASIERLKTMWANAKGAMQSFLADAAVGVIDFFTESEAGAVALTVALGPFGAVLSRVMRESDKETKILVNDIRKISPALYAMEQAARESFDGYIRGIQQAIDRTRDLRELQAKTGQKVSESDLERIAKAEEEARKRAADQYDAETIERRESMGRLVNANLLDEEVANQRIKEIEEERAKVIEKAAAESRRAMLETLQAEAAQRAAQAEREKQLQAEIKEQTEINELIKGRGPLLVRLGEIQAKLAKAEDLTPEERLNLLKEEARLIPESRKEQERLFGIRRAGRAGRKTEGDLIAANLRLEKASLDAQVSLNDEQKQRIALIEWEIRLSEIDADLKAKKITASRAEYETRLADLALQKEIAKLQADAAKKEEENATKWAIRRSEAYEEYLGKLRSHIEETEKTKLDDKLHAIALGFDAIGRSASLISSDFGSAASSFGNFSNQLVTAFSLQSEIDKKRAAGLKVSKELVAAQKAEKDALMGGIGAAGELAAAFFESEREKAGIMALTEAAMSFAAYPDVAGMISHGTAAAMFAAIAGGAVPTASAKQKAEKDAEAKKAQLDKRSSNDNKDSGGPRTVVINVNNSLSTSQDVALAVKKAQAAAANNGRSARW